MCSTKSVILILAVIAVLLVSGCTSSTTGQVTTPNQESGGQIGTQKSNNENDNQKSQLNNDLFQSTENILNESFNAVYTTLFESELTDKARENLFNQKYKDKTVKWVGYVHNFDDDIIGRPVLLVNIQKPNQYTISSEASVLFKESETNKLLQYKIGQKISFEAKITEVYNLIGGLIRLSDGILIEEGIRQSEPDLPQRKYDYQYDHAFFVTPNCEIKDSKQIFDMLMNRSNWGCNEKPCSFPVYDIIDDCEFACRKKVGNSTNWGYEYHPNGIASGCICTVCKD